METELKLLADPEARHLVEDHPAFRAVRPRDRQATSTYYDTKDLALYRLGACLRVRETGTGFVQTVKLDQPGAEIGSRGEWEWPLSSAAPDPGLLTSLPDEALAIRALSTGFEPLFVTIVERRSWQLTLEGETEVEAVFDQGVIRAGARSLDISEVELELKGGPVAPMYRLAIDLAERVPMRFGAESKSERGYGLAAEGLPERPPRRLAPWESHVTIGEVFPRLVHAALRDLADEISAASAGEVEGVHRMRAAIRRLRSMLVLFGPCLDRRAARRFNAALREFGAVLGQGRDWDVFLTETLPRVEGNQDGIAAAPLRAPAERRCAEAHAAIAEALRGSLLTGLILGMGAWTADSHWLRRAKPDTRFMDLVPDLLDELRVTARKRARKLDADAGERLHDLRKALKKLRYSVDDLGSLFAGEAVDHYLHAIKSVLGTLGDINDAAVTEARVAELAPTNKPDLAPAAAALLHATARRKAKAFGKLGTRLDHFHAIEPFWT